jgi:hypothetical protein
MKSSLLTALWAAGFVIPSFGAIKPLHGATVYGVAVEGAAQTLVTWDSAAPGTILTTTPITGLPAGETIRGMDFDPVNFIPGPGTLFAIGAGSSQAANVYRILSSGFASKLSPLGAPPADAFGDFYGVTSFGSGALRSISDTGRLAGYLTSTNSGSGEGTVVYTAGDANAGAVPHVVHRFNSFVIDTGLDVLATITSNGSPRPITTIGPLGADFDDVGGMDAATESNTDTIYAALLPARKTSSQFYTVNQQTGATTLLGPIGSGLLISAMAVEPPLRPLPEPRAMTLIVLAIAVYLSSPTLVRYWNDIAAC